MRPAGKNRFSPIEIVLVGVTALAFPPLPAQGREESVELGEEQTEIKEILRDLGRRMQSLAKKLDPTDPDEARRVREASDRIHNSDLSRVFDDISTFIQSSNFLEAVGKQDKALEELDAIIRILERSRFDDAELEKRLDELEKTRKDAAALAGKQDSLLKKTRDFLEKSRMLADLKSLKDEVSKLKEQQARLNEGAAPEQVDPGAGKDEEKSLEKAVEVARRLLATQETLNRKVEGLPQENLPIQAGKELLEKLDDLVRRAEDLVTGTQKASREAAKDIASAQGGSRRTPSGKDGEGAKTADEGKTPDAGQESGAGTPDAGAPDAAKTPDAGKGSAKDAGSEKAAEGSPEEGSKAGSGTDTAKTSSVKGGPEGGAAKDKESQKTGEKGAEGSEGKDGGPVEARARLEKDAAELATRIDSAAKDASGASAGAPDPKEAARRKDVGEGLSKSSAGVKKALDGLRQGDLERALAGEKGALQDLKQARDRLAEGVRGLEESNALQTAGLLQEQGLLEAETVKAASDLAGGSEQASSQAGRSAIEEGSQALGEAAGAMQESAKGLQGGDRKGAQAAGKKASDELAKAVSRLEQGQKQAAGRSEEEKRIDLQKKLAGKAEEARKKTQELQKKLRQKNPDQSEKLGGADAALAEAGGSMSEAAQAGQKGEQQLAKKKGEEAVAQLERAKQALEEGERDALERLAKEKLKTNAPEQEQLARLTKALSKKLSEQDSQGGGDQSQAMDQASESMDEAADELEKEEAEAAQKAQEEALAKLQSSEEALKEEEERLAQLKREREMISMVDSLTVVKESQERINAQTVEIDATRQPQESRRQKLRVQTKVDKLVAQESEVADQVDGLNAKLKEEYARVFTFVLKNVGADMRQIRDSLKELETGSYTQFLEKEVVRDLERLIATLKEQLEEQKQEPQEGQPPPQQPPPRTRLVPAVVELRMLREMQVEVNRGTRDLEDLRKASDGGVTESWDKALNRLMQKQGSVSRMTAELLKDFKEATSPSEEGAASPPEEDGKP